MKILLISLEFMLPLLMLFIYVMVIHRVRLFFRDKRWQDLLSAAFLTIAVLIVNYLHFLVVSNIEQLEDSIIGSVFNSSIYIFCLLTIIVLALLTFRIIRRRRIPAASMRVAAVLAIVWVSYKLAMLSVNLTATTWFVNYNTYDKKYIGFMSTKQLPIVCAIENVLVKIDNQAHVQVLCLSTDSLLPRFHTIEYAPPVVYKRLSNDENDCFKTINSNWDSKIATSIEAPENVEEAKGNSGKNSQ